MTTKYPVIGLRELDLSVRPHDGPNAALYWPEMAGGIFVYKDHLKREGSCGVRIFESDENSRIFLIVLTELKNNNGPSVTNAVEDIVNQLCCRIKSQVALEMADSNLNVPVRHRRDVDCTFVFVERYEVRPTEFDWVQLIYGCFVSGELGNKWHSPNWIRANKEETIFLLNLLMHHTAIVTLEKIKEYSN